jgi:hypothetical protein
VKDYGVVLKVRNDMFQKHNFFVCAGLGEWGTSGAAWYLANHWHEFDKESEFGFVVEVSKGSDTIVRIVTKPSEHSLGSEPPTQHPQGGTSGITLIPDLAADHNTAPGPSTASPRSTTADTSSVSLNPSGVSSYAISFPAGTSVQQVSLGTATKTVHKPDPEIKCDE